MSQVNGTVTGNSGQNNAARAAARKAKAAALEAAKAEGRAKAERRTVGDKKPTKVETVVYDISQAASSIAAHAGTVYSAKLSIGQAVNAALQAGVKLTALQDELSKLPKLDLVRVLDVVKFDSKATGLSKLGLIARVLGDGLTSPDKKHHVTPAQIEVWALSTEDACRLARYVAKGEKSKEAGAVKVSTLKKYCALPDGGAKAVREYIASQKPSGPNTANKSVSVALDADTKKRLLAAKEAAGFDSLSEFIATLLK